MMRSRTIMAVAVRTSNDDIVVRKNAVWTPVGPWRWLQLPVIRGTMTLIQSLILGLRALDYSSQIAMEDGDQGNSSNSRKPWVTRITMLLSMLLALTFGLILFLFLPLYLTQLLGRWLPPIADSPLLFNLVDGIIRIVFFLGYILLITLMPDIRRFFAYHGAEHKVIYTYEADEPLTVDNARRKSPLHPRCGTAFLMVVMVVAIIVFSLIPKDASMLVKFGGRILFLPVIAGLSYEWIRFAGKRPGNFMGRFLVLPGIWLQKLTTREPDDGMLEVAIRALEEAHFGIATGTGPAAI